MRVLVAVCLLAGCDVMFKAKHVDDPIDAPGCGTPDEDGDCIADDVDNCPGIANAQQLATGEADTPRGAGDACDPEPTTPGNAIKRFFGFVDPATDPAAWEPVSTWRFDDGQLTKLTATSFGIERVLEVDDDAVLTVEATFVYQAGGTGADARMAVWVDIPLGNSYGGQTCWVTPDNMRLYAQERMDAPGGGTAVAIDIPPLQLGDVITLRMLRDRTIGALQCTATINGATASLPVVMASGPWLTGGHIGVQAQRLLADVRYVTLYAR